MRTLSCWISFPNAELDTECGTADPFDSGGQDRAARPSGWQSLLRLLFQQLHQKLLRGYHPRDAAPAESYRRLGTAGNRRASRAKTRQLCLQAGDFVTEVMHPAA